jgi:DNA modification methylase
VPEHARLSVGDLQTFERNPRRGDLDAIAASLTRFGQYRTIVVNAGSLTGRANEVLAGNHTMLAARQLGWDMIDATVVDVDEETARAIVAADNHLADLGEYDSADLHALLKSLEDMGGTGYGLDDLAALERELFPPAPRTDPDDVPDLPATAVSEMGQVWHLGDHRLLVGDCTDIDEVRRLCGGVTPDAVWTDPPYGVDYAGGYSHATQRDRGEKLLNDTAAGLRALLDPAFAAVVDVCRPGAPIYVAHADETRVQFETAMVDAGMLVRQTLIWAKNCMVLTRKDYHYDYEPILYGFTSAAPGKGKLGRGGDRWFGDHKQTTVFHFNRPQRGGKTPDHPTMKPIGLIDSMLENSLPPGGVVLDPFAGSGSTVIAAHGRSSRCYCIELDPRYADVILRRFEAHTGIVPTLDGAPISFQAA